VTGFGKKVTNTFRCLPLRVTLVVATAMASFDNTATAQSTVTSAADPADSGFEILLTPYLWLPWVDVGVRPGGGRIPEKSITISPTELYGHLTWVPFMGEAEFRSGGYGFIADYIHAPLTGGVSTHDILFNGINAGVTFNIGTAMFMYRPISMPG